MRMIGQEMAELSKKLSLLTSPSLRGSTGVFKKIFFFNFKAFRTFDETLYYRLSMARNPNLMSGFLSEHSIG